MTLKIEHYTRKPFPVEAVQVTEENLNEVAEWCGGDIHASTKTLRNDAGEETSKIKLPFIKVDVHRPLNDRQTKAFVGDWVLKSESGFKVYTLKAFDNSFQKKFVGESSESVGKLSTDAVAVANASEGLPQPYMTLEQLFDVYDDEQGADQDEAEKPVLEDMKGQEDKA